MKIISRFFKFFWHYNKIWCNDLNFKKSGVIILLIQVLN
jgi:hypothetical protein